MIKWMTLIGLVLVVALSLIACSPLEAVGGGTPQTVSQIVETTVVKGASSEVISETVVVTEVIEKTAEFIPTVTPPPEPTARCCRSSRARARPCETAR